MTRLEEEWLDKMCPILTRNSVMGEGNWVPKKILCIGRECAFFYTRKPLAAGSVIGECGYVRQQTVS